eukprot:403357978
MAGQIQKISSKNHEINIIKIENEGKLIEISVAQHICTNQTDKDFILYFKDDNINKPVAIKTRNKFNEISLFVSILPNLRASQFKWKQKKSSMASSFDFVSSDKLDSETKQIDSNQIIDLDDETFIEPKLLEYIFLIDRSGSMDGDRIQLAVQALKLFLHSLPMGSKFNVVSFGSKYNKLFEESQLYNQKTFKQAIDAIKSFKANMGGTEIFLPLKAIFSLPVDQELPRHLYLLTDGEVNDTKKVVDMIKFHSDTTKVHCFGIGDGVSSELIQNAALAGKGHYSFISNPEDIEKKVLEALQKDHLEYLVMKEAKLLYENQQEIQNLLLKQDQILHGQKFNIIKSLDPCFDPQYVKMTFLDPNTDQKTTHLVQVINVESEALINIAAQKYLQTCPKENITELSIKYQILHHSTAMLAYEKIMDIYPQEIQLRLISQTSDSNFGLLSIFVKLLDGRKVSIQIHSDETVGDLKFQLLDHSGICYEGIRLIYIGKPLADHHTLQHYNIVNKGTIHMILQLRGGGGDSQYLNILNIDTQQCISVKYNSSFTIQDLIQGICDALKVNDITRVKLFYKDERLGVEETNTDEKLKILGINEQTQKDLCFYYLNYKSIVFCQNADGSWSDALFRYLKENSLQLLRDEQLNQEILDLNEQELLTLIAIKILQDEFPENINEFRLVVAKGKIFLKKQLNIPDLKLAQLIKEAVYQLS